MKMNEDRFRRNERVRVVHVLFHQKKKKARRKMPNNCQVDTIIFWTDQTTRDDLRPVLQILWVQYFG
jgi:hypothetical protein